MSKKIIDYISIDNTDVIDVEINENGYITNKKLLKSW